MLMDIIFSLLWASAGAYLAKKNSLNVIVWSIIGAFTWVIGLLLCWAYSGYKKNKEFKNKSY
ncbi:MAG: hypothetical protein ACRC57_05425 [Sarcina sp.]